MAYVIRRIGFGLVVLTAVSVFSFWLFDAAPGEFFDDVKADPAIGSATIESLRERTGLTATPIVRYGRWVKSVAAGDFGTSLAYKAPVASLLWARAQNTLLLTVPAMILTWTLAVPLVLWTSSRRSRWADRLCDTTSSALLTIPELIVALLCLVIALRTGWFPTGGMVSSGREADGARWLSDVALHAFLPMCALVASTLPIVLRHVRTSVVEVMDAPAIRAAPGHGIGGARLLFRYVLPMAANPLISLAGLSIGALLSTSLLVEVVMSWPGLGPLLLESILARDLDIVVGATLLSTVFLIAGNLAADVVLLIVDPRIAVEGRR